MHVRIFGTASGSVTVAVIFMRPPQRAHSSTSFANTRRRNSAHGIRAGFAAPSLSPAPQDLRSTSGAFGTISFRHAALGTRLQRFVDVLMSFSGILLAILIVALTDKPSLRMAMIAVGIVAVPA